MLPEVLPQVKATLKEMAPMGLREPQSKIRNSVAAIISAIAHWDWPEHWPNLFELMIGMLRDETVSWLSTLIGSQRFLFALYLDCFSKIRFCGLFYYRV